MVATAAWVVVRALGLERGYPMVAMLAYTPLVAGGAIVAVAVALLLRRRAAAACVAVLAAVLVWFVAPRALGGPSEAEGGPGGARLRVLTANLSQQPGTAAGLVEIVRETRPDVLSVQELTPPVARALDAAGLAELLPERVLSTRDSGYGSGLYSRLALERRPPVAGRSTLSVARAGLPGAPPLELYAAHPRAPRSRSDTLEWRADLRGLPPATPGGAIRIMAGDFNSTLDHGQFRELLGRGYEDAAAEVGAGLRATWPANRRFPPPVTIDHVIADARCGVRAVRVFGVPRSDHRAVFAELELPRE